MVFWPTSVNQQSVATGGRVRAAEILVKPKNMEMKTLESRNLEKTTTTFEFRPVKSVFASTVPVDSKKGGHPEKLF